MNAFVGTGPLLRLALRLDRVRLPIWVFVLAIMPTATAAQYQKLYPDEQSLQVVTTVLSNASLVALNGPLFSVTIGGLTAWKIGVTEFILVGLMSLLTVVRHSRTEEETGRLELLGATVVGRYAPLTAALLTAVVANVSIVVLTVLFLASTGLPASGSIALALAIGLCGLVFAAVAAVAAQFTASARSANAIAAAVLGASFLLRAIGDTGPTWVSWISPMGWAMRTRPYAGEAWWVPLLSVGLIAGLALVAYTLVARRDVGAGLLPDRPAAATGAPSLRSTFALAWRLHRGLLIGWAVGMVISGAVLGGAATGITDNLNANQQMTDLLARLGGRAGVTNAFLAAVFGIIGLTIAAYTVQATLRLRAEEASGRLEPLLATHVGRIRWAMSHLVFAVVGTALLLALAGAAGGLSYGGQINDVGHQVARLTGTALAQLPAALVLAGLGVALFGLVPKVSTSLTWAGLIACFVLLELGAILGLSQWIIDVSPFAHIPKFPGAAFTSTPLIVLTAIAVVLAGGGLAAFRRRDIG